jgi:hypothetical protein
LEANAGAHLVEPNAPIRKPARPSERTQTRL